jgi:hypothetical protein
VKLTVRYSIRNGPAPEFAVNISNGMGVVVDRSYKHFKGYLLLKSLPAAKKLDEK